MCRDYRFYLVDIFIAYDKIKRYTQKFNNANDLLYSEFMNELENTIKKRQIDLTDVIESAKKDFSFNKKVIEFLEDFEYRIKK